MKAIVPPKPSEFSETAIQKAVVNIGVKHPVTVYPLTIGASSAFVGWMFGMSSLYTLALAGVIIGPLWALSKIFFFSKKTKKQYLDKLSYQQQQYEKYLRRLIRKGLIDCKRIKGAQKLAQQGEIQFNGIQEKYNNIVEVLKLKISQTELTYGRFLGAAEQVFLSVLDNLNSIIGMLKSASSIQREEVVKQLEDLNRVDKLSEEDVQQKQALETRLALWDEQIAKVKKLLTNNEMAMTEMEKISAAVAEWKADKSFAGTDFESAITRLHELAEQASEYNTI